MNNIGAGFVSVIAGIIGLAIVAVLVSQRAQTPTVISSGGTALASIINAAVSPVTTGNGPVFGNAAPLGSIGSIG